MQASVDRSKFMTPARIMIRSFLFLAVCICWTYAVGIHEDSYSSLEHARSPSQDDGIPSSKAGATKHYKGSSASSDMRRRKRHGQQQQQPSSMPLGFSHELLQSPNAGAVQPFTACQLRFAVLLFLDSWFLVATAAVMTLITADRLQKMACETCIFPGHAVEPSVQSDAAETCVSVTLDAEDTASQHTSDSDASYEYEKDKGSKQDSMYPTQMGAQSDPDADTLALFRKAQAANFGGQKLLTAAQHERLGEMI